MLCSSRIGTISLVIACTAFVACKPRQSVDSDIQNDGTRSSSARAVFSALATDFLTLFDQYASTYNNDGVSQFALTDETTSPDIAAQVAQDVEYKPEDKSATVAKEPSQGESIKTAVNVKVETGSDVAARLVHIYLMLEGWISEARSLDPTNVAAKVVINSTPAFMQRTKGLRDLLDLPQTATDDETSMQLTGEKQTKSHHFDTVISAKRISQEVSKLLEEVPDIDQALADIKSLQSQSAKIIKDEQDRKAKASDLSSLKRAYNSWQSDAGDASRYNQLANEHIGKQNYYYDLY